MGCGDRFVWAVVTAPGRTEKPPGAPEARPVYPGAAQLVGPGGALTDQPRAGIAERMARLRVRRLDRRIAVAAVLAISLAGCGQFYWGKSGSTAEQFDRDSTECALEASRMPGGQVVKEVFEKAYRQCLRDRGYLREQKVGPPPGWHRGIE